MQNSAVVKSSNSSLTYELGPLDASVSFPVGALGSLLALEAALLVAGGGEALPALRLGEAAAQEVGLLEHAL